MFDLLTFLYPGEPAMILDAYHRAAERRLKATGESWPVVRASCVHPDGTITTTSVVEPVVIATWQRWGNGGYRISLV